MDGSCVNVIVVIFDVRSLWSIEPQQSDGSLPPFGVFPDLDHSAAHAFEDGLNSVVHFKRSQQSFRVRPGSLLGDDQIFCNFFV